jgi:hypothetical protein
MSFKTILAAFALVGLVAMPASAASLTAAELKALAPGSYAVSIYGFIKMTINLQPGGSITGVTSKKKRDSGYWTVDGNKLCIRWNRWLKNQHVASPCQVKMGSIPVRAYLFGRYKSCCC